MASIADTRPHHNVATARNERGERIMSDTPMQPVDAFRLKYTEEEREGRRKDDIITVRLNVDERRLMTVMKRLWHEDKDSTILKKALELSHNVSVGVFGENLVAWLAQSRRMRSGRK